MDYANPTEIWWPHPSALDDLSVEVVENEDGSANINLSAPDGSECGDWLNYFQETEQRKAAFERAFLQTLRDQITKIENGQVQGIPDEQSPDRPGRQEDEPGPV